VARKTRVRKNKVSTKKEGKGGREEGRKGGREEGRKRKGGREEGRKERRREGWMEGKEERMEGGRNEEGKEGNEKHTLFGWLLLINDCLFTMSACFQHVDLHCQCSHPLLKIVPIRHLEHMRSLFLAPKLQHKFVVIKITLVDKFKILDRNEFTIRVHLRLIVNV